MDNGPYAHLTKPTIRFCEDNLHGWIAQPANAYSSLAISVAGIYIMMRKNQHSLSAWLGWTALLTGLTSFIYHASFSFIGQLMDLGSMFLLASFLIVASYRNEKLSSGAKSTILILGTLVPLGITAAIKTIGGFNIGIPLFALLLAFAIFQEIQAARTAKYSLRLYGLAFAIFAVGWIIWLLDFKQIWCDPMSYHLIKGHAVWHLSNAVALLILDRYYETNERSSHGKN